MCYNSMEYLMFYANDSLPGYFIWFGAKRYPKCDRERTHWLLFGVSVELYWTGNRSLGVKSTLGQIPLMAVVVAGGIASINCNLYPAH